MKYAASLLLLATAAIATEHVTLTPCPEDVTTTVYETATAPPHPTGTSTPPHPPHHEPEHPECPDDTDDVFDYDCTFDVYANPNEVRNGTTAVPGQPGAEGRFRYGIRADINMICYNIVLTGVTGEYMSPALTATHIHEGARGASGPPRIAFPNPAGNGTTRASRGCAFGPFKTGLLVNNQPGTDTGDGFNVGKLCQNPAGFFTDVHTREFSLGAVRGQLDN